MQEKITELRLERAAAVPLTRPDGTPILLDMRMERIRPQPLTTIERAPSFLEMRGPRGLKGDPGDAAASYLHTQASASATWTINHNLGFKPTITLLTVGGVEFVGEIVHVSDNQVIVYLATATAGQARCN